jgi:hypothetical protein
MKRLIGVSALLAGLFLTPAVGRAQGTTFTACVVPKTGTLYLIRVEAAPAKCAPNHSEVSWQSGSTPVWGTAYYVGTAITVQPGQYASTELACLQGAALMTGGFSVNTETENVQVLKSHPSTIAESWIVGARNNSAVPVGITVTIKCAAYTPSP